MEIVGSDCGGGTKRKGVWSSEKPFKKPRGNEKNGILGPNILESAVSRLKNIPTPISARSGFSQSSVTTSLPSLSGAPQTKETGILKFASMISSDFFSSSGGCSLSHITEGDTRCSQPSKSWRICNAERIDRNGHRWKTKNRRVIITKHFCSSQFFHQGGCFDIILIFSY